jgi:flagellar biosynthesis anti-sigma factor FlgM
MRIDGFQNIPAVLQSLKAGRSSNVGAASDPSNETSTVNLTSFGSILQSLQREAASQIKTREAKVSELASAVDNGTLQMNLDRLAARMVDLQVIDFKE